MTPTHRCDYCGTRYTLPLGKDIVRCDECGEARMYNIRESRPSAHYEKLYEPPPPKVSYAEATKEAEEDGEKKRTKKQSKDVKAKKTSQDYTEKVRARYGYKGG